jgi:hypothetical protein
MLFLVYQFPLFPFQVDVVNNFLHSLFKQVDVFLKEKQVTQATSTYAYRAHLETLLNYGPSAMQKIPSLPLPCITRIRQVKWMLQTPPWPMMPILTLVLEHDASSAN